MVLQSKRSWLHRNIGNVALVPPCSAFANGTQNSLAAEFERRAHQEQTASKALGTIPIGLSDMQVSALVQNIPTVYVDLLTSYRIRKIKCDQSYPLCENCTTTGRQCEGSAIQNFHLVLEDSAKLKRRKWPSPFTIVQPGTALSDPREQRAFHFFLNQAAPTISGAFDTGFWTRLVPQVSHVEPAIQKALFTIGQLFDTPLQPIDANKVALRDLPSNQRRAYTWYGHAVNDLQHTISRGPQSIAMALLSCLLFACIEYQLHNPSCAIILQQKGIALLEAALDETHGRPMDPASSAILDYVIPFFSRRLEQLSDTHHQPNGR